MCLVGRYTNVDDCILEYSSAVPMTKDCALALRSCCAVAIVQRPARPLLVKDELGCVVAFVQILQHRAEDFGVLVGEVDAFACGLEELCAACLGEVWRFGQDVLVCGE